MKLAFVCGSCEPGADGVGDYTLSLARSLSERGHSCLVIALHDRHLDPLATGHPQAVAPSDLSPALSCLRLASSLSWRQRSRLLSAALKRFQPSWISLQYVSYAFHSKGLPWRLPGCLRAVQPLARWHVMAHELWVDPEAGLKNRALAALQQHLLRSLLNTIQPAEIHTSNPYYCSLLATLGRQASILPLFSSIPLQPIQAGDGPADQPDQDNPDPNSWSLILFGTIHPEWDPEPLLSALQRLAPQCGIATISLTSIGNAGAHGRELWQKLAATGPGSMHFHQFGALPANDISRHLQQADFGVTTTPSHLLGKSASVAAMLVHGLPVIVPRLEKPHGPWHEALLANERFVPLDGQFADRLLRSRKPQGGSHKPGAGDQLIATCSQLIQALQTAA
jgi:glycosyltransferase involved in cell wall biosynthesis